MFNRFLYENKQNPSLPIIALALGIAYVNFALYIQLNFLHSINNACSIAPLTKLNLIYFVVSGLIIAIIANLQLILLTNKVAVQVKQLGVIGLGPIFAGISIICGACSLPILGIVGINTILNLIGEFELFIKILSMFLLLIGLYLSVGQFNNKCVLAACNINLNKK